MNNTTYTIAKYMLSALAEGKPIDNFSVASAMLSGPLSYHADSTIDRYTSQLKQILTDLGIMRVGSQSGTWVALQKLPETEINLIAARASKRLSEWVKYNKNRKRQDFTKSPILPTPVLIFIDDNEEAHVFRTAEDLLRHLKDEEDVSDDDIIGNGDYYSELRFYRAVEIKLKPKVETVQNVVGFDIL